PRLLLYPHLFRARRPPHISPLSLHDALPISACDELHREGFRRAAIVESLKRFDVARFALGERTPVTTPAGDRLPAEDWARSLGLSYTPSVVFFGTDGKEAFRIEAYLRPFHLWRSLEYVASGAYPREPNFQR